MTSFRDAIIESNTDIAMDLFEAADAYLLVIDVPGADPSSTSVRTREDVLTITAERNKEAPAEATVIHEERSERLDVNFPLTADVSGEAATAELANGVLEITLPRVTRPGDDPETGE